MFLPFQPEKMAEEAAKAKAYRKWVEANPDQAGTLIPSTRYMEIEALAEMAIYLGQKDSNGELIPEEMGGIYRCTHLRANGDCAIYKTRPWMCRTYPYGRQCRYDSCTHDGFRGNGNPQPHYNLMVPIPMSDGTVRVGLRVQRERDLVARYVTSDGDVLVRSDTAQAP